jgi:hypothetical protein
VGVAVSSRALVGVLVAILVEVRLAVFVGLSTGIVGEAGELVGENTGSGVAERCGVEIPVPVSTTVVSTLSAVPAAFNPAPHAIIPGTRTITMNRLRKTDNHTPSGYQKRFYITNHLFYTKERVVEIIFSTTRKYPAWPALHTPSFPLGEPNFSVLLQ